MFSFIKKFFGGKQAEVAVVDTKVEAVNAAPYKVETPAETVKPAKVAAVKKAKPAAIKAPAKAKATAKPAAKSTKPRAPKAKTKSTASK